MGGGGAYFGVIKDTEVGCISDVSETCCSYVQDETSQRSGTGLEKIMSLCGRRQGISGARQQCACSSPTDLTGDITQTQDQDPYRTVMTS
jgi:hypothetical protein